MHVHGGLDPEVPKFVIEPLGSTAPKWKQFFKFSQEGSKPVASFISLPTKGISSLLIPFLLWSLILSRHSAFVD